MDNFRWKKFSPPYYLPVKPIETNILELYTRDADEKEPSFLKKDNNLHISLQEKFMANCLVPYSQDEQKWTSHYMAQAMKQIKPKEMTKPLKEKMVQPSIVLPTMQLVA